jgi:hypothetical protein
MLTRMGRDSDQDVQYAYELDAGTSGAAGSPSRHTGKMTAPGAGRSPRSLGR